MTSGSPIPALDLEPELAEVSGELDATWRRLVTSGHFIFGHAADLEPILALARSKGLAVLDDVAQALGGSVGGRRLGSLGSAGAFSFFPSKNLGGLGDGGRLAADNAELADPARMLRGHGSRRNYCIEVTGYNTRLDALQAAFLRAKLPRLDRWRNQRRVAAGRHRELLAGIPGISLPGERPGVRHVYRQFTIRAWDRCRDGLQAGIATMVYYPKALHELSAYAGRFGPYPEADAATGDVLSLPFWPLIPPDTQERMASAVRRVLSA